VLQPLLVRRVAPGDYQLVAGERRLRAAHLVGLKKVPVVVKDVDDRSMMELALVENIQREALDAIEEAKAYQTLVEKVGLTHEKLSERVGKQRVTITNSLRLLTLPSEVMDMVSRGTLSAGARTGAARDRESWRPHGRGALCCDEGFLRPPHGVVRPPQTALGAHAVASGAPGRAPRVGDQAPAAVLDAGRDPRREQGRQGGVPVL
jgi:ParB family chromosome partitioning protein